MTKFRFLFVALATVFSSLAVANQPVMADSRQTCHDVEFIFARGSGESLNDKSMTAWRQEIERRIASYDLDYHFYELGSEKQSGFQYPAVPVAGSVNGYFNLVGAVVSSGESATFGSSVVAGSQELKAYVDRISKSCSSTKFVLGGYSQGAMVMSRTLPSLDADKIIYLSTFGDPKLYLPEGKGIIPAACLGHNYSNYRVYVPDCHAYEGVLGSYQPYQPSGYVDKVGVWCNTKDIMCSSGLSLSDHTSYVEDGLYAQAAIKIAQRLRTQYPELDIGADVATADATQHNVAIIVDTTISMSSMINTYKAEAKRLAKQVLENGGKVALYEYRDLSDPYPTIQRCDYSCTYSDFVWQLEKLHTGGGGDEPESALSAILYAMNTLEWQVGATKSIVLLTDASYLSPDRDGTSLADVTRRSLEIDPVNVYIVTKPEQKSTYMELATATNGQVFDIDTELEISTEIILSRPVALLANMQYSSLVGDTLNFDASPSYALDKNTLHFDWDLDGDGEFEYLDAAATISKTYTETFSGFIQVRARDDYGHISTMSAEVEILDSPNQPATITQLAVKPLSSSSAKIEFQADADQVLLIFDDAILGMVDLKQTEIRFDNLYMTHNVTLVPYKSNQRGTSSSITISPQLPVAPNTASFSLESHNWSKYRQIVH